MTEISIIAATYNNPKHVQHMLESLLNQTFMNYRLIVVDDGSADETPEVLKSYCEKFKSMEVILLEHGERGQARYVGINKALSEETDYLLIIDSDMMLKKDLLEKALFYMEDHKTVDGLVIKEIPFSGYQNFYSKVKVFEREVINRASNVDLKHSIEAARFFRREAYIMSKGINPKQVSFEEIQPTIRLLEAGRTIHKLLDTGLYHDEKRVTLHELLKKKLYYFKQMPKTLSSESSGYKKAFQRFYLFRPVYYIKENLIAYCQHPLLFLGMIFMYLNLTLLGVYALITTKKS